MANLPNVFNRIWQFFTRKTQGQPLEGYRQSALNSTYFLNANLELLETPIRPIHGNINLSYELLEMYHWCYEYRAAIDAIASDCFQQVDGEVGSWYVPEILSDGTNVNPDVIAIAKELSTNRRGKNLILGGDFLERAAIESLAFGDSFIELGIDKEGIGRNDWDIVSSQYLPPFSSFVTQDQHGQTTGYTQRIKLSPSDSDVEFAPLKILHFKYKSRGLYGNALGFPSIESWRKLKDVSINLEKAARDVGVVPWLHIMAEGKTEEDRDRYRQRHESMMQVGIVSSLYLMNGADVRKAANASGDALKPLMDYWLQLRYQCIPPRVPTWMFPGLSGADGGANDLHGQPALTYARLISEVRAMIGEQVRWAITVKMVLRYGYDFYLENQHFDVTWPDWVLTPLADYAQELGSNKSE